MNTPETAGFFYGYILGYLTISAVIGSLIYTWIKQETREAPLISSAIGLLWAPLFYGLAIMTNLVSLPLLIIATAFFV